MLDKERVLSKLDELESYLAELESIMPKSYKEFAENVEKRRSCERLLHISIECTIDVCVLVAKGLKLGMPSEEEDIFEKLWKKKILSGELKTRIGKMRGFRNILVHRYSEVDDRLVFENLGNIDDFRKFKNHILELIKDKKTK